MRADLQNISKKHIVLRNFHRKPSPNKDSEAGWNDYLSYF